MKVRLGDVCDKASSSIIQKSLEKHEGKYPIYGASGLIKYVDFYQREKPYIAVVKDGAGKVYLEIPDSNILECIELWTHAD